MRWLVLAVAAVLLSGCGLPPAVTVASFALDVASYSATGKSVTDHGLSLVMQKDCALLRVVEGTVCVEEGEDPPEVALLAWAADSDARDYSYPGEPPKRLAARPLEPEPEGLHIAFATDPQITPSRPDTTPSTARRGSAASPEALQGARYLRHEAEPKGATARPQLGGAGSPRRGLMRPGGAAAAG